MGPIGIHPKRRFDVVKLMFELPQHTPIALEMLTILRTLRKPMPDKVGGARRKGIETGWRPLGSDLDSAFQADFRHLRSPNSSDAKEFADTLPGERLIPGHRSSLEAAEMTCDRPHTG